MYFVSVKCIFGERIERLRHFVISSGGVILMQVFLIILYVYGNDLYFTLIHSFLCKLTTLKLYVPNLNSRSAASEAFFASTQIALRTDFRNTLSTY